MRIPTGPIYRPSYPLCLPFRCPLLISKQFKSMQDDMAVPTGQAKDLIVQHAPRVYLWSLPRKPRIRMTSNG